MLDLVVYQAGPARAIDVYLQSILKNKDNKNEQKRKSAGGHEWWY